MDKAARVGIRIADLLDRDVFAERLRINLEEKNRQFTKLYEAEALSFDVSSKNTMNMVNKSNNM